MKDRTLRVVLGGIATVVALAIVLWFAVLNSADSRLLGAKLTSIAGLVEPSGPSAVEQ